MSLELLAQLAVLALLDSLSFGTLLIPLFFLLAPTRPRPGRMLGYLAVIAGFYFAVGLALAAGFSGIVTGLGGFLDSPGAQIGQLLLGGALLAAAFLIPTKPKEGAKPGRLARLRDRAMGEGGTLPLLGLALGAGAVELATMLPYLGAIGLLTGAGLPVASTVTVLAGYCLLMIAPALLLLVGRTVAGRLVEPQLRRLAAWLERTGGETTAWILGIVGFILAREAATALDLFDRVGDLV